MSNIEYALGSITLTLDRHHLCNKYKINWCHLHNNFNTGSLQEICWVQCVAWQ